MRSSGAFTHSAWVVPLMMLTPTCSQEFPNPSDAATAWEDFFRASKGSLSVSEIARIRDKIGVIGMGGT